MIFVLVGTVSALHLALCLRELSVGLSDNELQRFFDLRNIGEATRVDYTAFLHEMSEFETAGAAPSGISTTPVVPPPEQCILVLDLDLNDFPTGAIRVPLILASSVSNAPCVLQSTPGSRGRARSPRSEKS